MTDQDTAREEYEKKDLLGRCRYTLARDICLRMLDDLNCHGMNPGREYRAVAVEAVRMADALLSALGMKPPPKAE